MLAKWQGPELAGREPPSEAAGKVEQSMGNCWLELGLGEGEGRALVVALPG